MATVISGADYSAIATNYATARDQVLSAVDYIFDAVYQVVLLQDVIPEVDLLTEFYQAYLVNSDVFRSPVNFLSPVRSINNHVINRSTATTLDEYLDNEGITVPTTWATLSASAGFTISASNIA